MLNLTRQSLRPPHPRQGPRHHRRVQIKPGKQARSSCLGLPSHATTMRGPRRNVAGLVCFAEFRPASLQDGVRGSETGFAMMRGAARSRKPVSHHCKGHSGNRKTASHRCKAVFGMGFISSHRYSDVSGCSGVAASGSSSLPPFLRLCWYCRSIFARSAL